MVCVRRGKQIRILPLQGRVLWAEDGSIRGSSNWLGNDSGNGISKRTVCVVSNRVDKGGRREDKRRYRGCIYLQEKIDGQYQHAGV